MLSSSLARLDLEQIISAWSTNVFIKLILNLPRLDDLRRVYEPVNVYLR